VPRPGRQRRLDESARHGQRVVGIEGAMVHHVPVRVQLRLHEYLAKLGDVSLNQRIEDQVRAGEVRGDQRQDGRHGATLASA
jgi:hypothetical protein